MPDLHEALKGEITKEFNQKLQRDIQKWKDTMKPPPDSLSESEKNRILLKQDAMKRTMLLLGAGGMKVHGNTLDPNTKQIITTTQQPGKTDLPISIYMSGHGARAYIAMPKGKGQEAVNWISSGDTKSDRGIHQSRYFTPGNQEHNLQNNEIMYDRHSGTHGATIENGQLKELKGMGIGLRGMLGRVINKITFGTILPPTSPHLGINIPFGGVNQPYQNVAATISQDGKSGHAYFNLNTSSQGDTLGIGFEGTAPRTTGAIGSHSASGGADKFSMGEGEKYFIKYDPKSKNLIDYLKASRDVMTDQDPKKATITKYLDSLEQEKNRGFFAKLFNVNPPAKGDFEEAVKAAGLQILLNDKGKPSMISTQFGNQLLAEGGVIPYNYNGQQLDLQANPQTLNEILKSPAAEIPAEIVYFKPQASLSAFLAQRPIFQDIERKPLLQENPQLSLASCYTISMLSDCRDDPNISEDGKKSLDNILKNIDVKRPLDAQFEAAQGDTPEMQTSKSIARDILTTAKVFAEYPDPKSYNTTLKEMQKQLPPAWKPATPDQERVIKQERERESKREGGSKGRHVSRVESERNQTPVRSP